MAAVITAMAGDVTITITLDTDMAHMDTAADSGADGDGDAGRHLDFILERFCCIELLSTKAYPLFLTTNVIM